MATHTEAVADPSRAARRLRVVSHPGSPVGARPARVLLPNPVLGVLIFLAAEVMLFAGLISAFLVLRANADLWPPANQPRLPVGITAWNTLILLCSGFTMLRAYGSAAQSQGKDLKRWLAITTILGAVFLLIQGSEWVRLVSYGLGMTSGTYGATFYALIGCHGLHVLGGVVTLLLVLRRVLSDRHAIDPGTVQAAMVYWSFVVGIWPVLYVLVYLS